jgi:signal transduction histidine kinase
MRSLALKLVLAFLAISLVGTALVAVFAGQATASEFGHYTARQNQASIAAELAAYYERYGSWDDVENNVSFRSKSGSGRGLGGQGAGGGVALADAAGQIVMGGIGYQRDLQLSAKEQAEGIPIELNGATVGLLMIGGELASEGVGQAETEFLQQVNQALVWAAIIATAVALFLAIFLARNLTKPLTELTAATRAVAKGNLSQHVSVRSHDELGELAVAFNQMSADLAHSRDLRRQMTADIAHDLRTPISVILGHAEALEDGVLPPTPENVHIIHDEAQRLNRLVADLRILSLAEAGELPLIKRPYNLAALLERTVIAHAPQAQQQGVDLKVEIISNLPELNMDPDRMAQVLGNLVSNALRYTPADGRITLCAQQIDDHIQLSVRDTGTGIAPGDLPHVFDRFYRGDKSRQRNGESSSGLGLAIAKSIVEGHNGRIWAESQPQQGTGFYIHLPIE